MVSPINPTPSYTYFVKVDLPGNNQQRGRILPEITNSQRNNSESFPTNFPKQQKRERSPKNIFLVLPNDSKTLPNQASDRFSGPSKANQIIKNLLNNQQKGYILPEITNSQINNSENFPTSSIEQQKTGHSPKNIFLMLPNQSNTEVCPLPNQASGRVSGSWETNQFVRDLLNNQQRGRILPEISNSQRNNSESFPTSSIEQQKTGHSPENNFLMLPNQSNTELHPLPNQAGNRESGSCEASQVVKDLLNNQQKKRTLSEISNSQMNNSENFVTNSPKRRKMNYIPVGFEELEQLIKNSLDKDKEIEQKDKEIRKLNTRLDEKSQEISRLNNRVRNLSYCNLSLTTEVGQLKRKVDFSNGKRSSS